MLDERLRNFDADETYHNDTVDRLLALLDTKLNQDESCLLLGPTKSNLVLSNCLKDSRRNSNVSHTGPPLGLLLSSTV